MFTFLQTQVVDTLAAVSEEPVVEEAFAGRSVGQLFVEGGWQYMLIITLLLVAVFFFAWKRPKMVKVTGLMVLAFSVFSTVLGFYQAADCIVYAGGMSQTVIWAGVRVALIPLLYGLIVYMVSLVARAINKSRE